jgi:hypothetical protein
MTATSTAISTVVINNDDAGNCDTNDDDTSLVPPDADNDLFNYPPDPDDQDSLGPATVTVFEDDSEVDLAEEFMASISNDRSLMHETDLAQLWAEVPDLPNPSTRPSFPIRRLYDPPEQRVVDWDESAGKVCQPKREPNRHERWQKLFGEKKHLADKSYTPFSSRIDWEVAQWAVREKVSQGALNRLLKIPKVRQEWHISYSV